MSTKSVLNYWAKLIKMSSHVGKDFIGFIKIASDAYIGLDIDGQSYAPLFIFYNDSGWGDVAKTTEKFCWVLHVLGTDDMSLYMLFENESEARECAEWYTQRDIRLDPYIDTYKKRKWCAQN